MLEASACSERYCADFRESQLHGAGQIELGDGVYGLPAGDVNRDGTIDEADEEWIRRHNLTTADLDYYATDTGRYAADADVDFDGEVLAADRYYLLKNMGATACEACSP